MSNKVQWVRFSDRLPPQDQWILAIRIDIKEAITDDFSMTHKGEMEIMQLKGNKLYPGGSTLGWWSHWAELPDRPDDIVVWDRTNKGG